MSHALRGLVVGLLLAAAAHAAGEPMRQLRGSRPRALAHLIEAEPAPADLRLDSVTVVLGLRDRTGLDAELVRLPVEPDADYEQPGDHEEDFA